MGHNDLLGKCTEEDMCWELCGHGYLTAVRGNDTVMVRQAALDTHVHLQEFIDSICCVHCGISGVIGFPFDDPWLWSCGITCRACSQIGNIFGSGWYEWRSLPDHDSVGERLSRITTDGTNLWAVGENGLAYCFRGTTWETLPASQHWQDLTISSNGKHAFGIDSQGCSWKCNALEARPLVWERCPLDISLRNAALSEDGCTLWAMDDCGSVY